jgi:glycosyltransferase involved in cell wall biosynthesis
MKQKLSLVITTFNNADTISACIASAGFADDILVLDSFSTDGTFELARSAGARVVQEDFRGYGPQKQRAVDLAAFDRVLLLDADEQLSVELAEEIQQLLKAGKPGSAYRLRREEWLYWRWPRRGTGLTDHLRLFDRRRIRMGRHPVHAAPEYDGPAPLLKNRLRHHGHSGIAGQADRINAYSTGAATWPQPRAPWQRGLRLLLAPPAAFVREYLLRRQFLNGWAGFIAARMAAYHAFLRHAKRLEASRQDGP